MSFTDQVQPATRRTSTPKPPRPLCDTNPRPETADSDHFVAKTIFCATTSAPLRGGGLRAEKPRQPLHTWYVEVRRIDGDGLEAQQSPTTSPHVFGLSARLRAFSFGYRVASMTNRQRTTKKREVGRSGHGSAGPLPSHVRGHDLTIPLQGFLSDTASPPRVHGLTSPHGFLVTRAKPTPPALSWAACGRLRRCGILPQSTKSARCQALPLIIQKGEKLDFPCSSILS